MVGQRQNKYRVLRTLALSWVMMLAVQLVGCSTVHHGHRYSSENDYAPDYNIDVSKIPDAVPKVEPLSKYGNPPSYVACGHRYYVMKSAAGYDQKGIASWYGMKFDKFRTSSGEMYSVTGMTAAHKTLPLPTYVLVTNLENGRHVIVKVNDRGPFVANRIIDLSYAAAVKLGVTAHGTALVEVKAINPAQPGPIVSQAAASCPTGGVGPTCRAPLLYVQMGAFSQRSNAEQLVSKVKQYTDFPVLINTTTRTGLTLYRVQIGPIPSVDDVDALTQHLEAAGLGKPIAAVQ